MLLASTLIDYSHIRLPPAAMMTWPVAHPASIRPLVPDDDRQRVRCSGVPELLQSLVEGAAERLNRI